MINTRGYQKNLIFILILLIGLTYLLLFYLSFYKVFSGFFMQLIYLLEALRLSTPLHLLLTHPIFWLNLLGGFLLAYLTILLVKGLFRTVLFQIKTHKFLSSLSVSLQNDLNIFPSIAKTAFTAGFLFPKVYISESLLHFCSKNELKAIVFHEQKHQKNYDPLKDTIIKTIYSIIPYFPFKNYLFSYYSALVEIDCDNFSQSKLQNKKPLVSALYKIGNQPTSALYFSYSTFFTDSHLRIKSLVGYRVTSLKPIFLSLTIFILSLTSISLITTTTSFLECRHLLACLKAIISSSETHINQDQFGSNHSQTSCYNHL